MLGHPLPPTLILASTPKTESTELSIPIDTMKQFVATLDNQSKLSALTNSLLVSMPPAPRVPAFQLSLQECIEEIEKELSALHSQVCPCEQATLKPSATNKSFIPIATPALAANFVPMPTPAPKVRCTPVPPPDFDNTSHVVFISCPTTLTSKAAHGTVFPSICPTSKTANIAIFALAACIDIHHHHLPFHFQHDNSKLHICQH